MRTIVTRASLVMVVAVAALGGAACEKPKNEAPEPGTSPARTAGSNETRSADIKPATTGTSKLPEPKDPLAAADADMKKVLTELGALGAKPLGSLTPEEARKQPTPADAVKKVLEKEGKPTAPLEMAKVENKKIPGGAQGLIDARIYTPKLDAKSDAKKPLPVIAYWHGGGFVIADLDVYDASPRALATEAGAIVVSLDYRRAPEHKFPAAHDDAFAGYQWVVKNASSFGGDPKRIAVAGESAGGNLATNVAIMARDKGAPMPVHQLLVYPIAQTNMSTESYRDWGNAKPLDKGGMVWFFDKYTRTPEDTKDTRINLVAAKLQGLPKTTIILAEIDPLRSDGELLAQKLKAAGVDVDTKTYEGVTHEFFGMGAVVSDAKAATAYAGSRLQEGFKR